MILAVDVGWKATGWATFGGAVHPDGLSVRLAAAECGVIVPEDGLSPKALREQRKVEAAARLIERLHGQLKMLVDRLAHEGDPVSFSIIAEVPSLGAISAGAMRQMALALACFEIAVDGLPVERYLRSDVIAAMYGRRRPKGEVKTITKQLVRERMELDLTGIPIHLTEHVYDAAATLFAARDSGAVRVQCWEPGAMACLRMAR